MKLRVDPTVADEYDSDEVGHLGYRYPSVGVKEKIFRPRDSLR